MKKLIAILLSLAFVCCLAACTPPPEEEDTSAEDLASGMPSPITETGSLEELCETAGFSMVKPEGCEITDEAFALIDGEPQIAEYSFTADGKEAFIRFAKTGLETDISGIYTDGGTLFENSVTETQYIGNDELKAQRWFTVDGEFIFAVYDDGEWEWSKFDGIVSPLMTLEPASWDSETPFSEYKAVAGAYSAESGEACYATVSFDKILLSVYLAGENGETLSFEMRATLKDGVLSYEEENRASSIFNDEEGKTEITDLGKGGAGSVAFKDGTLDFSGAASEALRNFVFTKTE